MSALPICILYTQDPDLARRVKAFLRTLAQVRHVEEPDRLDAVLQQSGPSLLIIDLRAQESRELLEQIQKEWPETLIIALGTMRSEPLREAEQAGIYMAEDLQLDRRRFQALVARAFDHLRVVQETAIARGVQPCSGLGAARRMNRRRTLRAPSLRCCVFREFFAALTTLRLTARSWRACRCRRRHARRLFSRIRRAMPTGFGRAA